MQRDSLNDAQQAMAMACHYIAENLDALGDAAVGSPIYKEVKEKEIRKANDKKNAERAQQRWDALIKKDFAKAYTYTQPAFRAVVKPEIYPSRFTNAAQWKDVQVHEVKCEAERCTVRIRLNSKILLPAYRRLPDVVSYFDENWVRENGQWWYFDRY